MTAGSSFRGIAGICGPQASARPQRLQRIHAALAHRVARAGGELPTGPEEHTPRIRPSLANVALPRGSLFWSDYAVVADATFYNKTALCRKLAGTPDDVSAAELIARAYARWGADCTRHLEGDYAFALWDAARQLLFAARDPLGLRPFFYRWDGQSLAWASEVKALVADPDYSAAPDEAMVAEFLLGWSDFPDASATFYRGIRQLPGGHSLTLKGEQLSVRRYWDIDPADEAHYRRSLQANVEEFSALFSRAVERQLAGPAAGGATSGKIGLLLSGGVDSTSIASWAEKHVTGNSRPGPSLYYLCYFANEPSGDERAYAQSFQEKYGCPVHFLGLEEWWPLKRLKEEADFLESPFVDLAWGVTESWASHLREHGCGVVLTGLGGDNIFPDPGPASLADTVQRYGWRAGWRSLRHTSAHLGMPLAPFIVPTLRLLVPAPAKKAVKRWLGREVPEWMRPDFARRSGVLDRVRRAESRRGFSTLSQELDYRHLTTGRLASTLGYFDRVAGTHGFEFRHPFFDPSLVRFTVLVPPEHKTRDGETKVLLRQAMDGTLPEAVRERRDKGALDRFFTQWMRQHDRLAWEREAGNAEDAVAFIKPEKAAEMVRRFFDGDDQALKPAWTLLSLVLWLRNFEGRAS